MKLKKILFILFFSAFFIGFFSCLESAVYAAEKKAKKSVSLRPESVLPESEDGLIPVDTLFKIKFNQGLDPNTIDEKNVSLQSLNGETADFKLNYDKSSRTLIIRPDVPLKYETDYRVILKSGIESKSGKKLGTSFSYQYSTVVSPMKPPVKVIAVSPKSGQEIFEETPLIYAQFDQNLIIKEGEDLKEYVSVYLGNEKWPCEVFYTKEKRRLEIKPLVPLRGGKNYKVIISRKVKGNSGKLMAETYIWDFKTAEILFFVKYSYPNPKTKIINSYDRILFTFSESINNTAQFENYISVKDEKDNVIPGQFLVFNLHNLIFIPEFYLYKGSYKIIISKDFESFNSNKLLKNYEVNFTVKSDEFNSGDFK